MSILPVLCVFLPAMTGLVVGLIMSRHQVEDRVRWREAYRKLPEANLLRFK